MKRKIMSLKHLIPRLQSSISIVRNPSSEAWFAVEAEIELIISSNQFESQKNEQKITSVKISLMAKKWFI